mmetsp:Transcript_16791/g.67750  ORF Transcript_16791/g.67750 Transcript_16791/m.67750 type:complete len:109 (-) Transcript_16791:736-1062(-)
MKSAGGVFGEFILQGIKKEGMERVCLGGVDGAFSSREEARRRHTGGDHARDHHFVVSCEKKGHWWVFKSRKRASGGHRDGAGAESHQVDGKQQHGIISNGTVGRDVDK